MPPEKNESSSRTDPGLDGMPEGARKETEEILNELDKEATPEVDPEKPEAKKAEEDKSKPDAKKPEDEGKPDTSKKPEPRREVKLMPAYIHEIQKDQWAKEKTRLESAIEEAKKGTTPKKEEGEGKEAPESTITIDPKKIEALAEKHGITVELAKDMLELAAENAGKLPPGVAKELAEIKNFRNQQAIATESAAFNSDFDKSILPLIHAEYGKDISPDVIGKLREDLKALAYTPDFAKVPYDVLYKGNDQFRGVVPIAKKGAEGSRGGHTAAAGHAGDGGDEVDLTKPLGDEELKALTDEQFEKYEKNMAQREIDARKK